jgi:hypothetical protein
MEHVDVPIPPPTTAHDMVGPYPILHAVIVNPGLHVPEKVELKDDGRPPSTQRLLGKESKFTRVWLPVPILITDCVGLVGFW